MRQFDWCLPYQHGVIANEWVDKSTMQQMYCTQDNRYQYINEAVKPGEGTSPFNLKVTTVGDELRYSTGNQSKVVTVSGKDRGAILLAGKTGSAYVFRASSGNFASTNYYMQAHPDWVSAFQKSKPQDRFYGKNGIIYSMNPPMRVIQRSTRQAVANRA